MCAAKADVADIVRQITSLNAAYENGEAGAREKLIGQAYQLVSKLELPSEAIQRMGWAEPARLAQCQIAVDLGLFHALKAHGPEGVDVQTLAAETKANDVFLARLLRHLAAMNFIDEISPGHFSATPLSLAFTEKRFSDGITYVNGVAGPSFHAMPEYFKSINYGNPTSLTDGPFQYAHKTQSPFFAWLAENPRFLPMFNNYMSAYRAGKPTWTDAGFYPISKNLVNGFVASDDSIMLVDVGGGLGHDLKDLKSKHPDMPGRLVLQDREEVVNAVSSADKQMFEPTTHDFFTPQPLKHARAYYLHSVLHDWSDEDCIRILANLVPALKLGYSKVLINEIVVPETNAGWPVTSMDWLMLALGTMRERTQSEWESIVKRAGLKITKIYTYELGTESLIEAELP